MDASRRSFLRGRALPANAIALVGPGCLALRGIDCRVCGEHCDARAIRFPPRLGGVAHPVIDPALCTGCSECQAGCPAQVISMTARSA